MIAQGGRNTFLTRNAGRLRRIGLESEEIEAALLKLNQARCQPPLPADEVARIARSISRYAVSHQPTDDELVDTWLKQHPDTAYGMGEFRRYKDGCWPILPREQVEREMKTVAVSAKGDGYKPTFSKLRSVFELGRIEAFVPMEAWNRDKDLLVCRNGTLHIPTLKLQPHDKNHRITSGVAYAYDPGAAAPVWDQFCKMSLKEAEGFLQEFAGYALTIDTSLETAAWLYGPPGSGKSTFISGLTTILGAQAGILGLADLEKSRFGLVDLPDKTLLVSTEQPSMFLQATEKVNALISGEPLLIDRKFRDPVIVQSHAKICWAMNELPRIGDANNGLFRRVKVVEFAGIPEAVRNPNLKQRIKSEGSGLLNWALRGLSMLSQNGFFTIPSSVVDATTDFKRINDIPGVFVEERCERGAGFTISSTALYAAYRQWCLDNGHKMQSSTSLALDWRRLGLSNQHTRNGSVWHGVKLKGP
jgi:putative DNA primase/helicase